MRIFAAVAVVLVLAPNAPAAAAPGWKQLIADWYDGRIDGVYTCSTYRTALRHLPQDGDARARHELERRLEAGRCVGSPVTATRVEGRNYVADGVAAVLAIVAVVLIVRRRRQLQR